MQVLVIHNSDEVKDVIVGTSQVILTTLKNTTYWADVVHRLEYPPGDITLDMVTDLYHDGDSEDGYSLLESMPAPKTKES